ncbi:hypothetical protein FH972_025498 [Carpinus fangiana]|uniref:CUE domain-containing protein n=1 Tax=Carpinus fangiana TaxID=176857 RepID=A0A5N6L1G0_9ROSI|nr:hypothetical protein FH972_025498 [Carpinus fangiana]
MATYARKRSFLPDTDPIPSLSTSATSATATTTTQARTAGIHAFFKPLPPTAASIASPPPKKKPRLMQTTIDLGGDPRKTCPRCGMQYLPAAPEDARAHSRFCARASAASDEARLGVEISAKEQGGGRVVRSSDAKSAHGRFLDKKTNRAGDSVVEISRRSGAAGRVAAERVLEVVEAQLGAVRIGREALWGEIITKVQQNAMEKEWKNDAFKVYLYVRKERCVGLCLAQKITRAKRVLEQKEATAGQSGFSSIQTEETSISGVYMGISRIWVASGVRGVGIARELLDAACSEFLLGRVMKRYNVAFSQPTESGFRLARKWFGQDHDCNGDLNLNTSLDVDDDLLDHLGRSVQIDEALVYAHLKGVPGLGTLTARSLAGGDLQVLGGQADGALDTQVLGLGTLDQLGADLLEGLDLARVTTRASRGARGKVITGVVGVSTAEERDVSVAQMLAVCAEEFRASHIQRYFDEALTIMPYAKCMHHLVATRPDSPLTRNIVTKISDSDWRICIDSWIFLLNGYLAAPLQELEEVSKQYGSLVDFLRAALRWTASNPASSRSLHDPELRRLVFLNVHHLLLDSASPSSLLLDWTFLGDFRRVFHGSGACTNTLLSAYDQHSETIEEQLHQIKSQLTTTFESAKAASLLDFANNHDDSLLPLMKAIPGIGTYFVTGSDLLDAAVSGTKPNASLLFDHLYSLKAPLSTTTSAPPPGQSLISDLITDTPLLSIITRRLSGVQATRANTIISTLEPLRRAHSSRPHRKPTIAQKGKATALSAASEHPVHAHRLSLITQIQDLFPDLGSAFVLALLDHFTDDVEAVTAALLDDSLPPNLQSLDRASNLPSPSFSESTQHVPPPHSPIIAPTHQPRLRPTNAQPALETTSGSFPTERRNKYDNDAFDSLAVSTSQLHLGKRNQRNTADTLLSSGTSSNAKAAILAALSAFDADDDERDDTSLRGMVLCGAVRSGGGCARRAA